MIKCTVWESLYIVILVCPQNTRIKEGIYNINPNEEPLRSELLGGKFTVLVSTATDSDEHNVCVNITVVHVSFLKTIWNVIVFSWVWWAF